MFNNKTEIALFRESFLESDFDNFETTTQVGEFSIADMAMDFAHNYKITWDMFYHLVFDTKMMFYRDHSEHDDLLFSEDHRGNVFLLGAQNTKPKYIWVWNSDFVSKYREIGYSEMYAEQQNETTSSHEAYFSNLAIDLKVNEEDVESVNILNGVLGKIKPYLEQYNARCEVAITASGPKIMIANWTMSVGICSTQPNYTIENVELDIKHNLIDLEAVIEYLEHALEADDQGVCYELDLPFCEYLIDYQLVDLFNIYSYETASDNGDGTFNVEMHPIQVDLLVEHLSTMYEDENHDTNRDKFWSMIKSKQ